MTNPAIYIFVPGSPAYELFESPYRPGFAARKAASDRLKAFALRTVREHPAAYVRIVLRDLKTLTTTNDLPPAAPITTQDVVVSPPIRQAYAPSYRPSVEAPVSFLSAWTRTVRLPQPAYLVLPIVGLAC